MICFNPLLILGLLGLSAAKNGCGSNSGSGCGCGCEEKPVIKRVCECHDVVIPPAPKPEPICPCPAPEPVCNPCGCGSCVL
ncbi:MAG: hypothetical protein LBM01_00205 [Christensenellaceae bacterium]|nr:hypothetical protein [Christensenellaceae bacterium]